MSNLLISLFLLLTLCLSNCAEKVIVTDFSMKQAAVHTIQKIPLSTFLGKHEWITLEKNDSLTLPNLPRIIKRETFYYVLSEGKCHQFDNSGNFIKAINIAHLINDENVRILNYDIVADLKDGPEWWIGLYDGEYTILRININTEKIRDSIRIKTPIRSFKYVGDGVIFLALSTQQYMVATCNLKGEIMEYGLKKKALNSFDGYTFYRNDDNYLFQYQMSSLVALYDKNTKKIIEATLIKDDGYVHTWQKELEYIEKQGEARGVNACSKDYNTICQYAKQGSTSAIYFNDYNSLYLSIKKKGKDYQTIRIEPYSSCSFINDLPIDISDDKICRYLAMSFQGRTDSDDSILFYFVTESLDKSKKDIVILDILDDD